MKVAPLSSIPSAALVPALNPVRPVTQVVGGERLREMQRAVAGEAVAPGHLVEGPGRAQPGARAPAALPPRVPQTEGQAVAQALRSALTRQSGLAPLLADLGQALQTQVLSPQARAAALQLLSQLIPLDPKVGAAEIKRALKQSGLFLESRLASHPDASPLGEDLKAALLVLRQTLGPSGQRRPAGATPPPPYGGAPTSAQPAAMPSLPATAGGEVVAQALAAETQGALAHLDLLQLASRPDRNHPDQPTRWMFETALQTPQGPGVAQFEISRDPWHGARDGDRQPHWRARFSVDFEPVGAVDAQISLEGDRVRVGLWVARDAIARGLDDAQGRLRQRLAAAGLQLELAIHSGRAPEVTAAAGRLLDQSA